MVIFVASKGVHSRSYHILHLILKSWGLSQLAFWLCFWPTSFIIHETQEDFINENILGTEEVP